MMSSEPEDVVGRRARPVDGTKVNTTSTMCALGLGGIAYALTQTMLIPAFPVMIHALHSDANGVSWTVTGYFISAAVGTPLIGRLGDIFGKRRVLVAVLVIFSIGCVIAAASSTLWVVIGGRVIQGASGGIFPLCFAIIRDEFPHERVSRSVGLMSSIAGAGGGLGLIVGGLIVDHAPYYWIFWMGSILGVAAAVATMLVVPDSPTRTPARVDVRGACVLALSLILLLVAISQANSTGWEDPRIAALIAAGIAILCLWVTLQRHTAEPLADIAMLVNPPVAITNLATLFAGYGMFGSLILITTLAQAPTTTDYGFGLDATHAGLLMLPGYVAMLVLGPISGNVGHRLGNKVPLAVSGIVTSLGLSLLAVDHGRLVYVSLFSLVTLSGIGLGFAAMPNVILDSVPQRQAGEATGINALVRAIGSALGSQVSATIVAAGAATGIASDAGFTHAFAVSAVVAAFAGGAALFIPRSQRRHTRSPLSDIGAAGPLALPASPEASFSTDENSSTHCANAKRSTSARTSRPNSPSV